MAQVDYFPKIEGVEAESADKSHKGEIALEYFSWGQSQTGTAGRGGGGGAGKVMPSDFSFVKRVDKSSPVLMIACATGKHYASAILTARKSGDGQQDYLKVTMEDVLVSSYQTGGSANSDVVPMDQISLNFGKLSFLETISVLDRAPEELGYRAATSFFSHTHRVRYRRPGHLIDVCSGVISSPNNFAAKEPLDEGWIRVSVLANHDRWSALGPDEYALSKQRSAAEAIASAARFVPDWTAHEVFRDVFTPRTIRNYTGHVNGCIYGATDKHASGRTHLDNLYLCGNDQGLVGIVGTMMSGIAVANEYLLK